jgi:hypothetical protein
VIVSFVDTGGIVDHRYLEVIVSFVDTGGIVDHRYLEVIVSFVDTGIPPVSTKLTITSK